MLICETFSSSDSVFSGWLNTGDLIMPCLHSKYLGSFLCECVQSDYPISSALLLGLP